MNTQTKSPSLLETRSFLDGHALNVLEIISQESTLSQREVAQKAGISVGLVNLTVKRLVQTGYLKVTNLSSRRAEYLLTPKGLSEVTSKSYQYLVKTVRTYQQFSDQARKLIEKLTRQGHSQFIVLGEGEIANLIIFTLKEMRNGLTWRQENSSDEPAKTNGEIILDCRSTHWGSSPGISVLSQLMERAI